MVQTLQECLLAVWVWAFGPVLCPHPEITYRHTRIFNKKQFAECKHGSATHTSVMIWRHTSNLLVSSLFVTPSTYSKRRHPQKCTNPRRQVPVVAGFCTVAPNICGSSVRNLRRVTLLAPRIFSMLLHFLFKSLHPFPLVIPSFNPPLIWRKVTSQHHYRTFSS